MSLPQNSPDLPETKTTKSVWGVLIGVAVGVLCELGGYLLMRGNQEQFGTVVFVLVPFLAGFLMAVFTPEGARVQACTIGTLLLSLSVLIFTGLEGYICCFMAFPLLLIGIILGATIGVAIKKRIQKGMGGSTGVKMLFLAGAAFLLVGARNLERPSISIPRQETFARSVTIPVPPAQAWELIKAMKRLEGPKPFLLQIGLPVPQSCELDRDAVGGKRVCHFNSGIIAQEVTAWQPPQYMRLKITESTLPGRHWLKFVE